MEDTEVSAGMCCPIDLTASIGVSAGASVSGAAAPGTGVRKARLPFDSIIKAPWSDPCTQNAATHKVEVLHLSMHAGNRNCASRKKPGDAEQRAVGAGYPDTRPGR
jgi:hypothetical protein